MSPVEGRSRNYGIHVLKEPRPNWAGETRHRARAPWMGPSAAMSAGPFDQILVHPRRRIWSPIRLPNRKQPARLDFFNGYQPLAGLLSANILSDRATQTYPIVAVHKPPQIGLPFEGERIVWSFAKKPDFGLACQFN